MSLHDQTILFENAPDMPYKYTVHTDSRHTLKPFMSHAPPPHDTVGPHASPHPQRLARPPTRARGAACHRGKQSHPLTATVSVTPLHPLLRLASVPEVVQMRPAIPWGA